APLDTYVVETGAASTDASPTSAAVVTFAASPSAGEIRVTFAASVCVTLHPASWLPAPMATATSAMITPGRTPNVAWATMPIAKTFGASFRARAKFVNPAESQCRASSASMRLTTSGGQSVLASTWTAGPTTTFGPVAASSTTALCYRQTQ